MRLRIVGMFAFLAAAAIGSSQTVVEFKVDDAWGRDAVQFATTAPVEDIVGTTNQVTGFVRVDPKNIKGPATSARIDVDVASFKTGIEMRDGGVRKALGAEAHQSGFHSRTGPIGERERC